MLRLLAARIRRFLVGCGGNVAAIYALALVPITLAAGGAIDYARAVMIKTALTEALDTAALAVAQSKGLSDSDLQLLAQKYFNANYHQASDCKNVISVSITKSGQNILVSASCDMPTTVLQVLTIPSWTVKTSSTVTYGQTKLWVSLVLDNTGSMSQTDKTGLSKMTALKNASHALLTLLQNASANPGDVQVAIIPFAKDVNVGTASVTANWLDWTDWDSKNGSCSISGKTDKTSCEVHGVWTSNWWGGGGSCSISGYYSQTTCQNAVGVWTPAKHSTWNGCVTDRGYSPPTGPDPTYNYDVNTMSPDPTRKTSLFPAEQYSACTRVITSLNYNWTALNSSIDAMSANGSTNQTIGLVWGWHAMTQGAPLTPPALPDQTQRVIIILSDGLNTQNRWWGNGSDQSSAVDGRMAMVCSNAKAAGIVIYAVYVDIGGTQGNSSVLQSCASDISKYYDLTSSGDIQKAFTDIGQQITNLRVSQ